MPSLPQLTDPQRQALRLNLSRKADPTGEIRRALQTILSQASDTRRVVTEGNASAFVATSGTWTPVIACASTAGSNSYMLQQGYWRQPVPNLVFFACGVWLSSFDGASSGQVTITGLPKVAAEPMSFRIAEHANVNIMPAGEDEHPTARIAASASTFTLVTCALKAAPANIDNTMMQNTTGFGFWGWVPV